MNTHFPISINRMCVIALLIIPGILILMSGCSDDESPTSPSDPVIPRAAVYSDNGVWSSGASRIFSLLSGWGWETEYISSNQVNSGYLDTSFNLVIFPGGDAGAYNRDLNSAGESVIRNFVSGGGGYVGICAGAFWATDRIIWHGNEIDYPLNLIPGTATGPLEPLCNPGSSCWIDVEYTGDHPACDNVTGSISSYYFDGPEMDSPGTAVFARYTGLNTPAAVATEYGSGRVAVIGIHPEMSGSTEPVLRSMVNWVSREVSTTNHDHQITRPLHHKSTN